jgi:hypothetical protein
MPGTDFTSRYFLLSRRQYVSSLCSRIFPDTLVEQHERETSQQTGYSLQTAVLLASMLFIAWQNRAYIWDYALQAIVSHVRSLKGSII